MPTNGNGRANLVIAAILTGVVSVLVMIYMARSEKLWQAGTDIATLKATVRDLEQRLEDFVGKAK